MRQKSGTRESSSERLVTNIRRVTRKQYSSEEKIRIGLDPIRWTVWLRWLSLLLCPPFTKTIMGVRGQTNGDQMRV